MTWQIECSGSNEIEDSVESDVSAVEDWGIGVSMGIGDSVRNTDGCALAANPLPVGGDRVARV